MPVRLTRRRLLLAAAGFGGSILTAACQPQVVEKIVEKPVEVTRVVEKVVEVEKEKVIDRPVEVTRVVEKVVEVRRTVPVEVTRVVERKPGPVRLRFSCGPDSVADAMQALCARYMEQHPHVQISVDVLSDEQQRQAHRLLSSYEAPDVAWMTCTPTYGFTDMLSQELLVPLDDLYRAEGWLDAFPKGILDFQRQPDKHYYSATISVNWAPYVYYNKSMFRWLGIEPPATWDQLYSIAARIREAGYQPLAIDYRTALPSRFPEAMHMRCWAPDQYRYMPLKWRKDAPPDADKFKWTDRDSVRIFTYTRALVDQRVVVDDFAKLTEVKMARDLFTSGRASMYQAGSREAGVEGLSKDVRFDLGYFYYPPVREDKTERVGAWAADGLVVPARGGNIEEAKRFVAWAYRLPQASLYARTTRTPHGRSDLPKRLYGDALTPLQLSMISDNEIYGTPPLFETVSSDEYYAAAARSIDLMLFGGLTPNDAAAWLQEKLDKMRAEAAEEGD